MDMYGIFTYMNGWCFMVFMIGNIYQWPWHGMDTPDTHPFKGLLQEVLGGHHRGARWAAVDALDAPMVWGHVAPFSCTQMDVSPF